MPKHKRQKGEQLGDLPLRERILDIFKKNSGELFKTNEISKMIGVRSDSDDYQMLRDELRRLERDGVIIHGSRRRYGIIPPRPTQITGIVKMQPTGNAIVKPEKDSGLHDTVLIRARNLANAVHGDKVSVALYAAKHGERPQGEIIEILERASKIITGRVEKSQRNFFIKPESGKLLRDVLVTKSDLSGAKPGDKVKVELYDWEDEHRDPEGKVLEVFGRSGSFKVEMQALAAESGLPGEFPKAVIQQAESYPPTIPKEEIVKRLDLRKETIFTIDPEDAKDFDDAISLTENDDWTVTLGVHIADVSHFVTEGSPLDKEALERGTSIYLAGGVIPMLPEQLSNDLCSLKPDVERLTYSVIMTVDPMTGKIKKSECFKSIIKSAMRFSYEEAEKRTTSGKGKYAKLLKQMRELSEKMYAQRRKDGSIDFETDEVRFKFDDKGNPTEAYKKGRLGSMKMIEEFMLAANRAVAEFISKKAKDGREKPFLYRIHADPDPDKVRDLAHLAKSLGYSFNPEGVTPKTIQKFLESIKGKPEEKLLNGLMLRAMAKAIYAEHNVGHFGLAFLHYTHFTSPIRRYPDLIIHRMLHEYMQKGGMMPKREHYYFKMLPDLAEHTSAMERRATEAERDSAKIAQLFVMASKVGEEFDGIVTGVQHYGFFVGLENGAEGLVHIRELNGYYTYDEAHLALIPQRSGSSRGDTARHKRRPKPSAKAYRIGEKVRVKLIRVNETKRALDFGIAEE
ncbi:MAG: ribonuclease R [Bacteroidota bacterium]|nr:ribonuclease R [Bacteroidota bacterium]